MKNYSTKQTDLVQFHPSYAYEDFVRGIEVKNVDDKVVYKTINKTIATIAKTAKNWDLHNASKENMLPKNNG
ncbi:MAG: hypothetical protein R2728_00725 [Chitinophagales bacterium]